MQTRLQATPPLQTSLLSVPYDFFAFSDRKKLELFHQLMQERSVKIVQNFKKTVLTVLI